MPKLNFDDQALAFDHRTGLPIGASQSVAEAVAQLAGPGWVLDLGAGTGAVGLELADLVPTYLGIDLSLKMLTVYRDKLSEPSQKHLVWGDADRPWPIADDSVGLIFSSRAAHLLRFDHLIHELIRVAHSDGAVLVLGSVRRAPDSVRDSLRQEMRRLLRNHGIEGRGGRRARRGIFTELESRGGQVLPPKRPASWPAIERPADSLASWRSKNGLAGRAVDPDRHHQILDELEAWARERWGDLNADYPSTDHYELEAIRLGTPSGDPSIP